MERREKSERYPNLRRLAINQFAKTCKLLRHFPLRPAELMERNESMEKRSFGCSQNCFPKGKLVECVKSSWLTRREKDSRVVKHSVGTLAVTKLYDIDESSVSRASSTRRLRDESREKFPAPI